MIIQISFQKSNFDLHLILMTKVLMLDMR
jgi:hypothetical protein